VRAVKTTFVGFGICLMYLLGLALTPIWGPLMLFHWVGKVSR